jgi:Leucine-rich repeat (LRR) protein
MNSLSGTIPPDLCAPTSALRLLNLRNNMLKGPAQPVTNCRRLVVLDLSSNQLTGSLPAATVRAAR